MIVVTPEQMRALDKTAIEQFGIPGIVLMENAAVGVVNEIKKILDVCHKTAVVIAGKGNNGGDAFAVARHLYNLGMDVSVYVFACQADIKGDAKTNLEILYKMGITVNEIALEGDIIQMHKTLNTAHVVVDGLLGTGLKGEVSGIMAQAIEAVNASNAHVVSIDIPSGVNGATGNVSKACIKAEVTVTFGYAKLGQLIHPGCEYVGRLEIVDIAIPAKALEEATIHLIDKAVVPQLPKRHSDSNKGMYGKVFVVAGSIGMTGAACLTANAALRTGSGLVYMAAPKSLLSIYATNAIEAITIPLEDEGKGYIIRESVYELLKSLERFDALAVGPGLSLCDELKDMVHSIIIHSKVPIVLDADGINALVGNVNVLKECAAQVVITPHPGEMARLLGVDVKSVQADRVNIARKFSTEWGVITVLKGSRTVIAAPDGSVYINTTGNPGMSTGGSGDVLTGIIASLIGQRLKPLEAAIAGVYLHGLCGDKAADTKGEYSLIAGDLIEELPSIILKMSGSRD